MEAEPVLIVNRNARQLRASNGLAGRLSHVAQGRALVFVTRTLDELERAVEASARAATQRVVLCGGDGTLMAGVSALARHFNSLPEVCFAPCGTMATVARNWGIRAEAVEIVERALTGDSLVRTVRRSLRVKEVGGAARIGFIFGTGLVAGFFSRYTRAGATGRLSAARIVARTFLGSFVEDAYARSVLAPLPCELAIDGVDEAGSAYSLVVCSVVPDLGLHLRVTYRADEHPERIHLVASRQSPRQLGPQAWRVLFGKRLAGDAVIDRLVDHFTIRFPLPERGPYVLDGDLFRAHEISVRSGPALTVLVPRS